MVPTPLTGPNRLGSPLLRETALDAREKLRHAAAAAAGVDAL